MRFQSPFRSTSYFLVAGLLVMAALAPAQSTGWRKLNASAQSADPSTPVAQDDAEPLPDAQAPADQPPPVQPPTIGVPSTLTIRPGTFLTVRVDQPLSSDHNQQGDYFSGTLNQPVVIDGIVVAQRGQTVSGRVSQVAKGGHGKGPSKLGLELTSFTAVDGQQVPLQTQLVTRAANHSNAGRNVATVGTTTAVGAVIGTAADWGTGAAIGAGIGAIAGLAGVLATPGAPAVVYPESVLTFRVQAAAVVSTDRAPQAFRYVETSDYQQPQVQSRVQDPPPPAQSPAPYYAPYPYPYPYPYYAYGPYYPYWGPGFGVVIGPRWGYGGYRGYYRGGFYRGGYYRGWRR